MKQFLILLLAAALILCGCRSAGTQTAPTRVTQPTKPIPTDRTEPPNPDAVSGSGQLKGRADTLEEAEEIAALYGIVLVDYQNGLALYYTDEDPEAVIARGEENGWPQLSLNRIVQLY